MHTITWLIWLIAAATAVALTPHPLYLALIFMATGLVFLAWRGDSPLARSYSLFLRAGGLVFLGYVIFSVITVGGMRGVTVLLALPALTLPDWLGGVVLGGPITAEALAWGATNGLRIWTLLLVFGTFNALVDHYRLLRLTPRSLFHAGLAVTIAVAFVPSVLRAIGEITAAQRIRGHRFAGPRSWLPLVAPLLAGSLEKAVQLAEALDARGYGQTLENRDWKTKDEGRRTKDERRFQFPIPNPQSPITPFMIIGGLLLLGGGLFAWLYGSAGVPTSVSGAMIGGGALLLGLALRAIGRHVKRTSYRRERWRLRDSVTVAAALVCVAALIILRLSGLYAMAYYPLPRFTLPAFDLRVGLALLLLAAPTVVAEGHAAQETRQRRPAPRRARRAAVVADAAALRGADADERVLEQRAVE